MAQPFVSAILPFYNGKARVPELWDGHAGERIVQHITEFFEPVTATEV